MASRVSFDHAATGRTSHRSSAWSEWSAIQARRSGGVASSGSRGRRPRPRGGPGPGGRGGVGGEDVVERGGAAVGAAVPPGRRVGRGGEGEAGATGPRREVAALGLGGEAGGLSGNGGPRCSGRRRSGSWPPGARSAGGGGLSSRVRASDMARSSTTAARLPGFGLGRRQPRRRAGWTPASATCRTRSLTFNEHRAPNPQEVPCPSAPSGPPGRRRAVLPLRRHRSRSPPAAHFATPRVERRRYPLTRSVP